MRELNSLNCLNQMIKRIQPLSKVVSLTAWFKLPEQGMKQFDVLSQASALPIISNNSLVFLTSQHVVLPWLYRHYYTAEWLDFVKPQHTVYTIECRDSNGIVSQFKLNNNSIIRHPTRDVVALSLHNEHDSLFYNTPSFDGLITLSDQKIDKESSPSTVAGYEITDVLYEYEDVNSSNSLDSALMKDFISINDDNHNGFRNQVPVNMEGCYFSDIKGQQHFLKTPEVLIEGMCGGGVFGTSTSTSTSAETTGETGETLCHGIIEGIVPLNTPNAPELAGHASYIDSVSLLKWLKEARA